MISIQRRTFAAVLATALCGFFVAGVALDAAAQSARKRKELRQARFLSYDAAAKLIVVKKRGKQQEFHVDPDLPLLKGGTVVKINGSKATLETLPEKAIINISWVPWDGDKKQKYAMLIDAENVPEELLDTID
ncbi:MAG: hypothetical protein MJE66_05950 [Proteobacteria bacterium]|nr:hypothetical protein [Pseudomonadota bacterium]